MPLRGIANRIEFEFIRDQLGLPDATCSKQMSTLDVAEIVTYRGHCGSGVEPARIS
jgi:hypothetical protein